MIFAKFCITYFS